MAGIKNVDNSLLTEYRTALTTAPVSKSLAEVQERIDKVNKDEADADAIVQPVLDAKNQIDLLAALQANFDRVNKDWIQQYAAGATGSAAGITFTAVGSDNTVWGTGGAALSGTPQENIQDAIDAVNTAEILALTGEAALGTATMANTTATDAEEQAEITALIEEWIANDVAPAKIKANTVKASKILEAIFAVQEADTENGLYSALIALANLDGDNLPAKALNAKIAPFYLSEKPLPASYATQLNTTANVKANLVTVADKKAVDVTVVAIGAAATAIDTAETAVPGSSTAAQKTAFTKELQKLADYTSHETAANKKFLMSTIDEELLVKYAVAMKGLVTTNTVATVQGHVTTVNEAAALDSAVDIINDANSTSAQVRDALIDVAVERNTGGSATDALAFLNLSAQAKLEVAELVVKNKPAGAIGYANMDAIIKAADGSGAIKAQQAAHAAKVAEFNAIGDLGAVTPPTTVATKGKLDTYGYAPYKALTNAQKLSVATEINGLTKDVAGVDTPLDFTGADAVKTLKEANDIIDAAIAAQK